MKLNKPSIDILIHHNAEADEFLQIDNFTNKSTGDILSEEEFIDMKDKFTKYINEDIEKSLLLKKQLISLMDEVSKNDALILEKAEMFFYENDIEVEDTSYLECVGITDDEDLFTINYFVESL
jgi:hypothetical protein